MEQQTLRGRWLACDEGFGRDTKLLEQMAAHGLWYFAEVPQDTRVWQQRPQTEVPAYRGRGRQPSRLRLRAGQPPAQPVSALAVAVPTEQWQRQVIKEGSKGPLVADFACLRVVAVRGGLPGPEVWLVLRRHPDSGEVKIFVSNAPATIEQEALVRVSGMTWAIERCFEEAKQHLGMDAYEVRSWRGWHHHMTLCLLAHLFLVRQQQVLKRGAQAPA